MMQAPEIVQRLRGFSIFESVPLDQLEWLARESEVKIYTDFVLRPGDTTDQLMVILEGSFRVYNVQNQQQKEITVQGPGSVTGFLPFSRMLSAPVYAEVIETMTALELHKSKFHELLQHNYELVAVLVHQMIDRVRLFTTAHFQNEKLMSLGKLSAGLAHELNNPAAAIVRSAEDLHKTSTSLSASLQEVRRLRIENSEIDALLPLLEEISARPVERLTLMDRSKREDDIIDWLGDRNIPDDHADSLVDRGITAVDLDRIGNAVSSQALCSVLEWLGAELQREKAVDEIAEAARRISSLVRSIKAYTRMDQVQDMQQVDITEGIRNTLMILQHKVRKNNVQVDDRLADSLPTIRGFPGELTQVWTNLIDNALDAMKGGGTLTIASGVEGSNVVFKVTDTGTGIPKEHLPRIFDPFFTTKDIGEGTGVGLDVVQKVLTSHAASIKVVSEPGHTQFTVCFPYERA